MEIRDAHPDEYDTIGRLMVEAYACLDGFPKPSEQPATATACSARSSI
jgi:hypothetical protein